jgi:HTH-type transcriptional regulator, competence development regulator
MRFKRSKEWWLARIAVEPDVPIGAGSGIPQPVQGDVSASADAPSRTSFGEFVHLLRRRGGLSVDEFAEAVDIEVREAIAIEEDPYYRVEARTVWVIARKYDLSQAKLNEMAGVVKATDIEPFVDQHRYAARSELRSALSADEIALLNVVVSVIEDRAQA